MTADREKELQTWLSQAGISVWVNPYEGIIQFHGGPLGDRVIWGPVAEAERLAMEALAAVPLSLEIEGQGVSFSGETHIRVSPGHAVAAWVSPHAAVTVDGRPVVPLDDGRFSFSFSSPLTWGDERRVTIEVARWGRRERAEVVLRADRRRSFGPDLPPGHSISARGVAPGGFHMVVVHWTTTEGGYSAHRDDRWGLIESWEAPTIRRNVAALCWEGGEWQHVAAGERVALEPDWLEGELAGGGQVHSLPPVDGAELPRGYNPAALEEALLLQQEIFDRAGRAGVERVLAEIGPLYAHCELISRCRGRARAEARDELRAAIEAALEPLVRRPAPAADSPFAAALRAALEGRR